MAHFQQSPISGVTVDLQTRRNTGAFSPRGEVSGIWQCVAGLRGFELAYDGIDAIVLKQSGERQGSPDTIKWQETFVLPGTPRALARPVWTGLRAGTEH